jgi:hypothetical protein
MLYVVPAISKPLRLPARSDLAVTEAGYILLQYPVFVISAAVSPKKAQKRLAKNSLGLYI